MAFEPRIAVFDACVLYPFHLRNVLVQAAVDRLVEARWSHEIHEEWMRNLAAKVGAIPIERLQATRLLMDAELPMATVGSYEHLVPALTLPDAGDRHVVATAIVARASVIVTWNVRHFPAAVMKRYGMEAQTPDAFLASLYDEVPDLVIGSLANARRNLSQPSVPEDGFTRILEKQGLTYFVARMRANHGDQ